KLEEKWVGNKRFSSSAPKPTSPAATSTVIPSEVEGSEARRVGNPRRTKDCFAEKHAKKRENWDKARRPDREFRKSPVRDSLSGVARLVGGEESVLPSLSACWIELEDFGKHGPAQVE